MSLRVEQAGMLSLLQDSGRFGQHGIGLTTGGPVDKTAFTWANMLLGNDVNATAIEVTVGGLELTATRNTFICLTGAVVSIAINGVDKPQWQVLPVQAGDMISIGYAANGTRIYLAVAGGFNVVAQFGSTATVAREGVGGIDGKPLQQGDELAHGEVAELPLKMLPEQYQPSYGNDLTVRVMLGYQQEAFSRHQQWRFFNSEFVVSERCDRMGFRLEGDSIKSNIDGILSEGICYGAIQIPADGQPIVLLNDRQTIGGYPKIGSALSIDCERLGQLSTGAKVNFELIDVYQAQNLLHLAASRMQRAQQQVRLL